MADVRWIGGAAAVAQVDDFTPALVHTNDTFTLTATGENGDTTAIVFTVGATETVAAVIAGLVALWNASTNYLCTPITASDATTTLKLTADTAGVPFYVASTSVGGTFTRAATTANSGPYDYNTIQNWDLGAVPGYAADQVIYIDGATILYGLDQTAGTDGADSVNIYNSQISANPSTGRDAAYLTYDVGAVFNINKHNGPGSPTFTSPVYLKVTTASAICTVYNTGTNSTTTIPSVNVILTSATSEMYVYAGSVGLSYFAGDVNSAVSILYCYGSGSVYCGPNSAIDNIYMNSSGTLAGEIAAAITSMTVNSGTVNMSSGAIGTLICNGGGVTVYNSLTTVNMNGGICYQYEMGPGAGAVLTLLTQTGGTFYSRATGTVTAANILGGICDASAEIPRTWTAVKLDPPGTFKFNSATQTLTAHVEPNTSTKIVTYSAS